MLEMSTTHKIVGFFCILPYRSRWCEIMVWKNGLQNWALIFAAIGAALVYGLNAFMPDFVLTKPIPDDPGRASALGLSVGVSLFIFFLIVRAIIRKIVAWPSRHKPKVETKFGSFTGSRQFKPDQDVILPFKFIPRKVHRQDLLKHVMKVLSKGGGGRAVIHDEGGTGKTALAAATLCKLHPDLLGGSLWINVDQRDLNSFLRELAIWLECLEAHDLRSAIRIQLAGLESCLLAVDNLDTAHEDVISFLINEIPPNCLLLVSTRRWDRQKYGELGHLISLSGTVEEARNFGQKFLRHLAKGRNTTLPSQTQVAILDAAPLGNAKAIEILLGQVEMVGLSEPIRDIKAGMGAALDDIIGRSFNLLATEERRVLCALSLFTPYALKDSLAGVTNMPAPYIPLQTVWQWRLAQHDQDGEQWWVSNHVSDYARARPETEEIKPLFAHQILALAVKIIDTESSSTVNHALDAQRENFFSAMDWCILNMKKKDQLQSEAAKLLTEYLRVLHLFLYETGYLQELERYAKEGMQVASPLLNDKNITADMAYIFGMTCENKSLFFEAENLYNESFALKRELGDKKGIAEVLYQLGCLTQLRVGRFANLSFESSLSKAVEIFEECLRLYKEVGETRLSVFALHRLGMLAVKQRTFGQAKQYFNEGLQLAEDLNDRRGTAYNLDQLGGLAHRERDFKKAKRFYERSLELKKAAKHERGTAYTLDQLGVLAHDCRDFKEAQILFSESLSRKRKLGHEMDLAFTLSNMGKLAQEQDNMVKAEQFYSECLSLRQNLKDKKGIADILVQIAKLQEKNGKLQEAINLLQDAGMLYDESDFNRGQRFVEHYLIQLQEAHLGK